MKLKVSRWTASSILFATLLVVSLYGCYSFISMPLLRSKNSLDLSYLQSAEYVYTAHVKPSLLYDNRTEVSAGEPLYLKLVERLDITLRYGLTQYPNPIEMTDIKLGYGVSASLSGGDWVKTYNLASMKKEVPAFTETYTVNIKEIEGIVDTIGQETGARAYSYTYEIKPRISLTASAGNKSIEQEFTPTLKIKFEGGKIGFEGLKNEKPGSVTHLETEEATWRLMGWSREVDDMRGIAITIAASFSLLLFYSGRLALRERESRTFMERLSGEIREKIIEAQEPPERIERATIAVGSLEDLARVAEEAFKPIIHHGDVFHVLDGDLRYEFRMAGADEES